MPDITLQTILPNFTGFTIAKGSKTFTTNPITAQWRSFIYGSVVLGFPASIEGTAKAVWEPASEPASLWQSSEDIYVTCDIS